MFFGVVTFLLFGLVVVTYAGLHLTPAMDGYTTTMTDEGLHATTSLVVTKKITEDKVVLITGGAGYIGSHTCVELLEEGYTIVVVDSFVNSKEESLRRVKEIVGAEKAKQLYFFNVDLRNKAALEEVFNKFNIDSVIHFAGLKAVGESVSVPLLYYDNNVAGTLVLLQLMKDHGVKKLVFSSSATVYGNPASVPISEDFPLHPTNPYGKTKYFIEEILIDAAHSDKQNQFILLRYFNPIGAHPSGKIGEDPKGVPNNLMPYVSQVAIGKLPYVQVFGKDWPTKDGTGVRDYIHVVDLAKGHIASIRKLEDPTAKGAFIYNLGTGKGYSVLEMVAALEKASGKEIPVKFADRRPGDIAECYADPTRAERELKWHAQYGLEEMCRDAWKWQSSNPNGYAEGEKEMP